jgi:hypothetical protein
VGHGIRPLVVGDDQDDVGEASPGTRTAVDARARADREGHRRHDDERHRRQPMCARPDAPTPAKPAAPKLGGIDAA